MFSGDVAEERRARGQGVTEVTVGSVWAVNVQN